MRRLILPPVSRYLSRLAAASLLLANASCANQSAPPGGPPDPVPPSVVSITPDSGTVDVRPRTVVFSFDEVVAEKPTRATTLADAVLVSPYQGEPDVRWHRDRISVRLPGGWRDSTVYVVTLLPGIADLRNNVLDTAATTVFSTGGPIPNTKVVGVVFDWETGAISRNALVQALVPRGRDTTRYVARSDSTGRYILPFVPSGSVLMQGIIDANRNFAIDRREGWDSTTVNLVDSAFVELYTFVHDTIGPAVRDVTVRDSVTIRLDLTRPLALDQLLDTSLVTLMDADSVEVPLSAVLTVAAADSLSAAQRAAADTSQRADSAAAPPVAAPPDVAPPVAQPDSASADSASRLPLPTPSRPIPFGSIVVRTVAPLAPDTRYLIRLNEARGLDGPARTSDRTFLTTPRDTSPPPSLPRSPAGVTPPDSAPPDSLPPVAVPPPVVPPPATPPPEPSVASVPREESDAFPPLASGLPSQKSHSVRRLTAGRAR